MHEQHLDGKQRAEGGLEGGASGVSDTSPRPDSKAAVGLEERAMWLTRALPIRPGRV